MALTGWAQLTSLLLHADAVEIRYILQDSACKFVITEDNLLPKVREH